MQRKSVTNTDLRFFVRTLEVLGFDEAILFARMPDHQFELLMSHMPPHPARTLILAGLRGSAFLSIHNSLDFKHVEFLKSLEPQVRLAALQGILLTYSIIEAKKPQTENTPSEQIQIEKIKCKERPKRKEPERQVNDITKIRNTLTDEQFEKIIPFLHPKDVTHLGIDNLRILVSAIVLKYTSGALWKEVDPNFPEKRFYAKRYREVNNLTVNNIFRMLSKDYGLRFKDYTFLPGTEPESPRLSTSLEESSPEDNGPVERPEDRAYYEWLDNEAEPIVSYNPTLFGSTNNLENSTNPTASNTTSPTTGL